MAVPKQSEFYRPVLEIVSDHPEGLPRRQLISVAAERLSVSVTDRLEVFNGTRVLSIFDYRVDSAARKLVEAGLLEQPRRGDFRVTGPGSAFLSDHTGPIERRNLVLLAKRKQAEDEDGETVPVISDSDLLDDIPEDTSSEALMGQGHGQLRKELVDDLKASLKSLSSTGFEDLVADLLVRMGYGEIGERGPRSRDGGVDGVIYQDPLGLQRIYLQAKLWDDKQGVSSIHIQQFSGSLDTFAATNGVYITTSRFTQPAIDAARNIANSNKFIRLIDGQQLIELMIKHRLGVFTKAVYEVNVVDENYFADKLDTST